MYANFPESLTSALGKGSDWSGASHVVLVIKKLPANSGDIRDAVSVPGLGRSPGGGHGNPLQSSCLENLTDRETSGATVYAVVELDTTEVTECAHAHIDWLILQIHLPSSCQPEIWEPQRVTTDLMISRLLCSSQAFTAIYHMECFKCH